VAEQQGLRDQRALTELLLGLAVATGGQGRTLFSPSSSDAG
jgi:hypothetical protein